MDKKLNEGAASLLAEAEKTEKEIIEDRRHIHQNPEVGFYLPDTADYIRKRLGQMGIASRLVGGAVDRKTRENFLAAGYEDMKVSTGVTATIGHGSPCILLRADMDALPMTETGGLVDFTSNRPGKAHMCGHDSHAAMLLGAARLLKEREDELKGTVKLMFQPGEECGCGARLMVEAGVMEDPKVDAAFAVHVDPQTEAGKVVYTSGIMSAAMDTFMVKIQGKGGHSSTPHLCIDPLLIANQLYTALNLLAGRETDPRETVALTVGKAGGGTASNVIPDTAEIAVGVRTFNREARQHMLQRVPEIIDCTIKMWRGEYEMVEFHTPSTYSDPAICDLLLPAVSDVVGAENVSEVACSAGTEDFGYFTEKAPGMLVYVGAGRPGAKPLHSPDMVLDESAFKYGAAIYANCAIRWLEANSR